MGFLGGVLTCLPQEIRPKLPFLSPQSTAISLNDVLKFELKNIRSPKEKPKIFVKSCVSNRHNRNRNQGKEYPSNWKHISV